MKPLGIYFSSGFFYPNICNRNLLYCITIKKKQHILISLRCFSLVRCASTELIVLICFICGMKFRTEFNVDKYPFSISHCNQITCLGSCFAEEMSNEFIKNGFGVFINPFGVIFNPISISNIVSNALAKNHDYDAEIVKHGDKYYSLHHHGTFASVDIGELEDRIRLRNLQLKSALINSDFLFITFGTANVYRWKETGRVVANCHKLPQSFFEKARLGIEEIVAVWRSAISALQSLNERIKIVFTVSPVRYLNFGMHEHQLSKAVLLLAVEELVQSIPEVFYFPAYELVIDDLRDYRFMNEDLIHPNKQAIQYVWEKLSEAFFDDGTIQLCKRVKDYFAMKNHKIMDANTQLAIDLMQKIETEKLALQKLLPFAKLD